MIDEAEALNSKKQNSGIGFVHRGDDESSQGLQEQEEDLLDEVIGRKLPRVGLNEEEKVENAELLDSLLRKSSSLSASHKIAELGLGKSKNEPEVAPATKSAADDRLRDFGAILTEAADNGGESDSDDLF